MAADDDDVDPVGNGADPMVDHLMKIGFIRYGLIIIQNQDGRELEPNRKVLKVPQGKGGYTL